MRELLRTLEEVPPVSEGSKVEQSDMFLEQGIEYYTERTKTDREERHEVELKEKFIAV